MLVTKIKQFLLKTRNMVCSTYIGHWNSYYLYTNLELVIRWSILTFFEIELVSLCQGVILDNLYVKIVTVRGYQLMSKQTSKAKDTWSHRYGKY